MTPKVAQRLLQEFIRDPRPDREKVLTRRQREVLQLLAEGHSPKETAAVLNITIRTVFFHKYQITGDYGLKTQPDLVMFAVKQRVVVPPT